MKNILILVAVLIAGGVAVYKYNADEPFLPLKEGQWELTDHRQNIKTQCLNRDQLDRFTDTRSWMEQSIQDMALSQCPVTETSGDNFRASHLHCSISDIEFKVETKLTKVAKSHYLITISTESTPQIEEFETGTSSLTLKRKGGC